MSPFKTFTAGETLTASDVNTYLAKQAVIVCTSGTRPGSPVEGMVIYETDTDKVLSYDGTTWNLPKNVPGGLLGNAKVTADQTGITTEVDLTGLSQAVTVGTGRQIVIEAQVNPARTVADGYTSVNIKEGTTVIHTAFITPGLAGVAQTFAFSSEAFSPSAGAHTYKLTMLRGGGTGTVGSNASAGTPAFIRIRDVGGA